MQVLGDGLVYLSRGEQAPYVCPNCEHIIEWFPTESFIVCEKCDCRGTRSDFSRVSWKKAAVN